MLVALPDFADVGGCYVRCGRTEPGGHIICNGGDLRVGIGLAKSRHEYLAVGGVKAGTLDHNLNKIGRGRVVHGPSADEIGLWPHGPAAVEAVATGAVAFEHLQTKARSGGGDSQRSGVWRL